MADLTCPAGMKLISGAVANHPELSDVPPFCIDETEVTNPPLDSYQIVHPSPERARFLAEGPVFAGPNQPAVFVDYPEARAYCQAKGGDLPTGDQWEKAARGPQGYEYGTKSGTLNHGEAQYYNESGVVHGTVDVKFFPPNDYGVYGMTGNVWEWTLEDYPQYGAKGLRGGSWFNVNPDLLAASYRLNVNPGARINNIGLRCAVPTAPLYGVAPSQDSKK